MGKKLAILVVLALIAVFAMAIGYREYRKWAEARDASYQRLLQRESAELDIAAQLRLGAVKMQRLRTEDDIARLEGRLSVNGVAIVDLENRRMTEDLLKSEQDDMTKELALLERTNPKPFPELFTALQAALEDNLDALVARRRANAGGNEEANRVAAEKLGEAQQSAVAASRKYAAALRVQSEH
jgi:hypothetical protein